MTYSPPSTRLIVLACLLALVAFGAVSSHAAPGPDDEWRLSGFWYTLANADDVRALARDGDGVWAATAGGGVVRWSEGGAEMRQYLAPQNGLPCNDVRDVVLWRGSWWFATCDGLAVYNPGRDRMEMVAADLPSPSVTALTVDESDRLWVATDQWWDPEAAFTEKVMPGGWSGGGIAVTGDGATWVHYDTGDGLPSLRVRDVLTWRGSVWIASEPFRTWQPPSADPDGGADDGRWDLSGGGVAQLDGATWRVYDSNTTSELSDNARVLAASDNALWVGTGGRGVVAFSGGIWKSLQDCGDELRCIQDNFVTALAVSGDGAVWAATTRFNGRGTGVNVLDDRGTPTDGDDDVWHVLRATSGLPGERVHAILPADDATVWFGAAHQDPDGRIQGRGLAHLLNDRATFEVFSSLAVGEGTVSGNDVTALARDIATGDLWVGTANSGVSVRRASGAWDSFTSASTGGGLGSDSVADIVIEPGGVVWVATQQTTFDANTGQWSDGGLSRYDGVSWTVIKGTDTGLPANHLSALELDGRGKLWVGTGATDRGPKELSFRGWGLAVIDTRTLEWERTFTFPTLTSNNITDLSISGNLLWVATSYFFYVDTRPGGAQISTGGGVSVYNLDTGQWSKITAEQGLTPALRARSSSQRLVDARAVLVDPASGVWVGSMAYPDGTYAPDVTPDGVVDIIGTDSVTTHRFPEAGAVLALEADHSGYVWAATLLDGVRVRVDGQWLERVRVRGGMPSSDLTAMSFSGGEVWFGTAGDGLMRLLGVKDIGAIDPALPTPEPEPPTAIIQRVPNHIYMPMAKRQVLQQFIFDPDPDVGGRRSPHR